VVGEVIAERYELEELVGSGGMSSVFRARDRLLERHVALKILHAHYAGDQETIERFRREARAVAQLSHPNIVTVIDRGQADDRQFIVFEYIDGQTLKEIVLERGPLPVRDAIELAIGVARGLAFAHANGIVHRDVKPQNVLLNGDGKPKVTDFGIARSLDVDGVTQTGTVLGTSHYIAPEQASGRPVDAQTDVYSLGAVLYELLTGEPPFDGESFVTVVLKHVHEQPPSVLERRTDCPVRLAGVVERALAKDPADRFPTMDAFAAELEAILVALERGDPETASTLTVPARAVSARPRRAAGARRSQLPFALAAVGAVLLAAAVAGIVLTRGGGATKTHQGLPPTSSALVPLRGISSYDPVGDERKHTPDAPKATDGSASTYWTTQTYFNNGFDKPGVGLVLDAGKDVKLSQLGISTDTPAFQAQIQVSDSPSSGFQPDSSWRTVGTATTFDLSGKRGRYWMIWLRLPTHAGVAHVNEVRAR
jgi:eukaryotic-like serine/threonine-protein kinase